MEFAELLHARRSVRSFEQRPIEAAKLKTILELTNLAPSAGNLQAYEIYQVSASKVRAALAHAANQPFVAQAPLTLVFFANPGRSARKFGTRGRSLYAIQDATIAATYAMLAIGTVGLGTVWVGAFDDAGVTRAVNAPDDWIPVAMLPIGYAAEAPAPTERRNLDELVHVL